MEEKNSHHRKLPLLKQVERRDHLLRSSSRALFHAHKKTEISVRDRCHRPPATQQAFLSLLSFQNKKVKGLLLWWPNQACTRIISLDVGRRKGRWAVRRIARPVRYSWGETARHIYIYIISMPIIITSKGKIYRLIEWPGQCSGVSHSRARLHLQIVRRGRR